MAEAGQGANADVLLFIQGHAPHGVDAIDGDQLLPGPFALPHLDQDVGTSGEDLGLGVFQTEFYSVGDAVGLIECLHIIHFVSFLLLVAAARRRGLVSYR